MGNYMHRLILLSTVVLCSFSTNSYAYIFNIFPNGDLPTFIVQGTTVTASYFIQNNTLVQRNNNFIKYLPFNVTILQSGCGGLFNLAPHGQPGDTCILNLLITGPVNGVDPDPHHHLFACFPKGISCAGTFFPLNVSLISNPPPPPG